MEENVIVKTKTNKGVKAVLVILIIMVLGLCAYIAYDKFVLEKDTKTTNEVTKTQTKDETKNDTTTIDNNAKDEVPITDKSAFIVYTSSEIGSYIYCYLEDGNLYYYGEHETSNNGYIQVTGASYSNDNYIKPKKYEGLTNIKRIKIFNEGTSVSPLLFLITDDGKVYWKDGLSKFNDIKFNQANDLKDYQIDDLLEYKSGDSPQGYYKFKLKDGTIKEITVNY